MITSMCDVLCVTDRALCRGDFLKRIEETAKSGLKGIILRAKELDEEEYIKLAESALEVCGSYDTPVILHGHARAAESLRHKALHLPLEMLRALLPEERAYFTVLGASCHSAAEAVEAAALGCTYITAGHVFDTDCKKGLPGRGLDFLEQVCASVDIPVYAIGGITPENAAEAMKRGAAGVAVMSGIMQCENVKKYVDTFREI